MVFAIVSRNISFPELDVQCVRFVLSFTSTLHQPGINQASTPFLFLHEPEFPALLSLQALRAHAELQWLEHLSFLSDDGCVNYCSDPINIIRRELIGAELDMS